MKFLRSGLAIALVAMTSPARPDDAPQPPDDATMVRIRELQAKGDIQGMRRELLAAFEATKHPALLFALGQVEYNLRAWQSAIDYYEQFIATNPPAEQISLARQGIVAARIEMQRDQDKPAPDPVVVEPRVRRWYLGDTVLVAAGGAAVALGTAAFLYGRHLGNDHGDTLAAYDARTDRARAYQWTGTGLAIAGLVTAGITVLRWRLRPDDGELRVTATGNGAAISVTW